MMTTPSKSTSSPSALHLDLLTGLDLSLSWPLIAGVSVLLLGLYWRHSQGNIRLPGPRGYPIVGNLLQLGDDPAQTYLAWTKQHGSVYKVTLGERQVVVVNSAAAAKELFNDLGSVYISRPLFHAFHKVVSSTAGFTIGTSPWDDSCKRKRRAAATALNKVAVQSYVPIMDRETLSLVEDVYLDSSNGKHSINPYAYLQRFALNISLVVNYGSRLESVGDAMLKEIIEVETLVANFRSVSGQMSDYVPILRYIPSFGGSSKASQGAQVRARRDQYMNSLLQDLKNRMEKGTDIPCITGNIIRDPEAKLSDLELSSICLSMVSAGLDTLANTFIWSVGYLAKHPQIQEKAYQAMYDVYQGEIPDSNEEKVEYITALHKECSRYFSVLKLALPRETLGDSSYRGVHIPSGTTVFLNAWAIHHDEQRYGDYQNFRPERFLDASEANQQSHYSYGAGRRMCAGVHLANRELYIAFCKLIHFFKIVPGEEDYDIDPATACANPKGLSSTPKPFKVKFVPRNDATIQQWVSDEKTKAEHKMAASISSKQQSVV